MAPSSSLHQSLLPSDFEAPFPSSTRPEISPFAAPAPSLRSGSPPLRLAAIDQGIGSGGGSGSGSGNGSYLHRPRRRDWDGSRSRSRRGRGGGKRAWKKLLWVKQSYPDNYTDQATFLENLQRNPRLQPYEFWPLVADSTVILQHVCSVIIFVVCFVGIFQERVSPVSVVSWSSFGTFIGWGLWDWWVGQEASEDTAAGAAAAESSGTRLLAQTRSGSREAIAAAPTTASSVASSSANLLGSFQTAPSGPAAPAARERPRLSITGSDPGGGGSGSLATAFGSLGSLGNLGNLGHHPHSASASSLLSAASQGSGSAVSPARGDRDKGRDLAVGGLKHRPSSPLRGGRANLRVNAMKSALLIYFTLLGLSPILKSLTRSTSSDSIWAMSFWLLTINIFFFDYSGTWVGANNIPVASLSTNAALMASTVLASRLPSTGQVFGLTLFSIEVFGLFPVFRRYARHRSWRYHVLLTILLVLGAGGGVGMTLAGHADYGEATGGAWPWKSGLLGMIVGCLISAVAMGGCSWWLLGLQKYKNEIYGPWDPARPIIMSRRHWDDD